MSSKPAAAPCLAESWEEIDEDRLPGTIKILKNTSPPKAEPPGGEATGRVNGSSTARQPTLPETLEEELKPKMVQRPMQILRRPQSNSGTDKSPLENKPKAQPKSLDQRKQEYAEARLRILGSAHGDEDETESNKKTSSPANGSRTNANNNNNSNNNSSNSSSNSSSSGNNTVGNAATGASGVGGASANNNGGGGGSGNNFRHFHPPYRQQQPVFYSSPPPLPSLPNHPAMHGTHPAMQHHPHHNPFPNGGLPLPYQQHQPQHPHFGPPMNGPAPHPYFNGGGARAGGLAGGSGGNGGGGGGAGGGYYSKGSAYGGGAGGGGIGDMNGTAVGPLMSLMGHGLSVQHPGGHPAVYGGIGYGSGGGGGGKGSPSGGPPPNGGNQHLLRLPAGPDGSQGFNMRR